MSKSKFFRVATEGATTDGRNIDRATIETTSVGSFTKIDDQVHIGHNCRLGRYMYIAGNTGLAGSVVAEDGVMISGMVSIKDHLHLAKGSIVINYSLAFFHLIPLPPLDGSKAVEAFLPLHLTVKFEKLQAYSFFILMGLLLSGALNVLSVPILFFSDLSIRLWLWLFTLAGVGVHFL